MFTRLVIFITVVGVGSAIHRVLILIVSRRVLHSMPRALGVCLCVYTYNICESKCRNFSMRLGGEEVVKLNNSAFKRIPQTLIEFLIFKENVLSCVYCSVVNTKRLLYVSYKIRRRIWFRFQLTTSFCARQLQSLAI